MPRRAESEIAHCRFCNREFRVRGLVGHERHCPHRNDVVLDALHKIEDAAGNRV